MSGERRRLLQRDAEARRMAQTEFARPVLLEAGAGTGKTTTLVARTVVWCLGRGWDEAARADTSEKQTASGRLAAAVLDGVVAITFTEAAAAEMAARVAEALAALAETGEAQLPGLDLELLPSGVDAAERARRAAHLLGALDHLTVRTIHAFCRGLLADHPLEAALHPELVVDADLTLTEEVVRSLVEARARDAYAGDVDHPLLALAARGRGPRSLAEALLRLVEKGVPAAALARSPFAGEGARAMIRRLQRRLEAFQAAGGERLHRIRRGDVAVDVARRVKRTRARLERLDGEGVELAERLVSTVLEIWDGRSLARLAKWKRRDLTKSEAAIVGESDLEGFARAARRLRSLLEHYARIEPTSFEEARRSLAPLLAQVEERLRARGVLTFAGLLREARDLLARRPWVRARIQRGIRQLLVDEFQDTDRLQCEIVRLLALEGPAERRPGLFLVGDPKQSIYGWRDADLDAYEGFLRQAEAAGGRRFSLLQNFRSAPPILDEINRAVGPLMRPRRGVQPAYEPLVACDHLRGDPGFRGAGKVAVEYWLSWETDSVGAPLARSRSGPVLELEARAIAADLVRLRRSGVRLADVGILLRASSHQDPYLEALREAAVPFQVSRDKQYFRRREVIDAAALVRAVIQPTDHLALVAFLRSPTVGVPDAAWIPLWRHGFPKRLTELLTPTPAALESIRAAVEAAAAELPADLPGLDRLAGWQENLIDAVAALADLRRCFRREPGDRFVQRLRRLLLPEATEAARFLGAYRIANLDRFFRRLTETFEATGGDVQAVLRSLRRSVSEAVEAQEALPRHADDDAVRVMTIHAAKGLEFEHLYLAYTSATPPSDERREIDLDERWSSRREVEYALFGSPTPAFDRVRETRERVAAAERVRTLYVALTRARRRLVVLGAFPFSPRPVAVRNARSHADLLGRRLPDGDPLQARFARRSEPWLEDEFGARWTLLGRLDCTPPGEPADSLPRLPPPTEIRREAEALAQDRADARRLRRRRRVAAASAEVDDRPGPPDSAVEPTEGDGRAVALAVGEAVHRMFESWDLANDPRRELATRRAFLLETLGRGLPPDRRRRARRRAERLLDRFASGRLFDRFAELRPRVLAREMPLIAPPARRAGEPAGAWTGVVDLVYGDASTGAPILVDFKTDRIESEAEITARAALYGPQAAVYRRAVRDALGLDRLPAHEIWFLWPDRSWELGR